MSVMLYNLWHLSPVVTILPFLYLVAMLTSGSAGVLRARAWKRGDEPRDRVLSLATSVLLWIGLVLTLVAIGERYVEAGRPPFKTLYESLILFAATTNLIYVAIDFRYRHPLLAFPVSAMLLGTLVFAAVKVDVEIIDLPAALQSPWFVPHVVVYLLGYGALAVGALSALGYLFFPNFKLLFHGVGGTKRRDLGEIMHLLNMFGFVLITAGLLMGAWWAKEAWGDWWSWDPKENWSLITWLVYVLYFHLRLLPGWTGRRMAIVTILGFAAVMFTYLGMNLLPTAASSAHVYQ